MWLNLWHLHYHIYSVMELPTLYCIELHCKALFYICQYCNCILVRVPLNSSELSGPPTFIKRAFTKTQFQSEQQQKTFTFYVNIIPVFGVGKLRPFSNQTHCSWGILCTKDPVNIFGKWTGWVDLSECVNLSKIGGNDGVFRGLPAQGKPCPSTL